METFNGFANLYELSKTLRFELKPSNEQAEKTKNILIEKGNIDLFLKQLKNIQNNFLDIFAYIDPCSLHVVRGAGMKK